MLSKALLLLLLQHLQPQVLVRPARGVGRWTLAVSVPSEAELGQCSPAPETPHHKLHRSLSPCPPKFSLYKEFISDFSQPLTWNPLTSLY